MPQLRVIHVADLDIENIREPRGRAVEFALNNANLVCHLGRPLQTESEEDLGSEAADSDDRRP
jgi:hypothetical protein